MPVDFPIHTSLYAECECTAHHSLVKAMGGNINPVKDSMILPLNAMVLPIREIIRLQLLE